MFNTPGRSVMIIVNQSKGGNGDDEHSHNEYRCIASESGRREIMENSLAGNIRSYRKNLGFTQEQLAERLGITLGAVSKWERGSSEPDLSYIMDLAELFHVSVDALIGFTMHGNDAEEEAKRIEETYNDPFEAAKEYEKALIKFPNNFRIVCGAALIYRQIGVVYRKEPELKRALELFRHSIELISQNKDPQISEVFIRNEIAACYAALKDYKRAIEEYKQNNQTGDNDGRIGCLLIHDEKKPEEGIEYTERSFFSHASGMITAIAGYLYYYMQTANPDAGIRAAEWAVHYLSSLKDKQDRPAYTDKITSVVYLLLAMQQDANGQGKESEESLRTAVKKAVEFDAHPVFSLENMVLLRTRASETSVYDDTGPTAVDGLKSTLDESGAQVSDAFRRKFELVLAETGEKKS